MSSTPDMAENIKVHLILYSMLLRLCAHCVWMMFSGEAWHWKVEEYVRTTRQQFNVESLPYRITVRVVD